MTMAARFRFPPWATAFTAIGVAIMVGMGMWQLQRLVWKNDLIGRLHSRMAMAPLSAAEVARDPAAAEYRKVRLTGTFLHDRELHLLARSLNRNVGLHVVTPLRLESGEVVLFNRGWVPEERKASGRRLEGQVAGVVAVEGIVRLTEAEMKGWLVPENRPDKNVWLTMDLAAMRQATKLDAASTSKTDRWWVAADATPNPGGFPIGGQTRVSLPNDHLNYAITWFLLAASAICVFGFWTWRLANPGEPPPPERG